MSVLYDEQEEKKYLYVKNVVCTNCEQKFNDIRVMNSKLRRKESDADLRPRFWHIDSLKYGITACPYCGFAAHTKNFEQLSRIQQKKLREKVTSQFMQRAVLDGQVHVIQYAAAVGQHELALVCAMAMELPVSEQAYLCLHIAWLLRGQLEEAKAEPGLLTEAAAQQLEEKQARYYKQAYDGLKEAASKEDFPICGMDAATYDYLLAALSVHFKEYELALRYCGSVVQGRGVSAKLKDKALMLKDDINALKKQDEEAAGEGE